MGSRHCLLCLHHFQIIGNAGGETVASLDESLFRQFDGTARHLNLFISRR